MAEDLNLYQTYLKEIEERKGQGLSPKPIDDGELLGVIIDQIKDCLLYTSPSPRD